MFSAIFIYLTAQLTFGKKGIIQYYKLEERLSQNKASLEYLNNDNIKLEEKLKLLNAQSVNSLYLEELARTHLHFAKENEKVVILNE